MNNNTTILPQVPKKVGVNKGKLQVRPDKGKLPANVPEPLFVADPNHRRKGLTGVLIGLDTGRKPEKVTLTRMDSTRIGKNFAYMARTIRNLDESKYENCAKAFIEHHFDNHEFCGEWCRRKSQDQAERDAKARYYRCKVTDATLYDLLQEKIGRFIELDRLITMAHGMDTNVNEAFNNVCTWFAPKNKVFAGSCSLHNRIGFAVGINSLGFDVFFLCLFEKLGIEPTANVRHYLEMKERHRFSWLATIRTREAKLKKSEKKYVRLATEEQKAIKEFQKGEGTYKLNMNIDDPFGELLRSGVLEEGEGDVGKKPPGTKKRKAASTQFCQYCGKKGHATSRSQKCARQFTIGWMELLASSEFLRYSQR
jgi:hypothetical protein